MIEVALGGGPCKPIPHRLAKNPRKWGNFFDFRAAYAEPPQAGAKMSPVRVTLPDGDHCEQRAK
jgi:hypothetical protein